MESIVKSSSNKKHSVLGVKPSHVIPQHTQGLRAQEDLAHGTMSPSPHLSPTHVFSIMHYPVLITRQSTALKKRQETPPFADIHTNPATQQLFSLMKLWPWLLWLLLIPSAFHPLLFCVVLMVNQGLPVMLAVLWAKQCYQPSPHHIWLAPWSRVSAFVSLIALWDVHCSHTAVILVIITFLFTLPLYLL